MPRPLATAALLLGLAALTACGKSTSSGEASAPAAAAAAPAMQGPEVKALLATLPAAYQQADLDNGEAKAAICKACHTLIKGGETEVGPNLWGVFGRKAGSVAGFSYSDGMKAAGWTWDADRINQWITNPRAMIAGTKMTYAGMEDPKDRVDLIAYLKVKTSTP